MKTRLPFVIALVLGLAAMGTAAPAAQPQDEGGAAILDEKLARVASKVPTFAGFTLTEESEKKIRMSVLATTSDSGIIGQIRKELAQEFGHNFQATTFQLREVHFSFLELKEWYDRLSTSVLAIDGVVHTDLDEAKNRLSIGVEDLAETGSAVDAEVAERGIPPDAVVVEQVPPVTQELRSYRRPFLGGLQIEWANFSDGFIYICSLGVNAARLGVQGFVTNSHCSTTQGAVDNQPYDQPEWGILGIDQIGVEAVDPPLLTGSANGCPSGRRCRYSDANFSQNGCPWPAGCNTTYSQGYIARVPQGSYTWNGSHTWRVVDDGFPAVGTVVQKTGRTTGRTAGSVTRTCVDINVSGTNITMRCQAQANYSSAGGDSGGPVFDVIGTPSVFDVNLVGIHWGSNGSFSMTPNVEIELGNGTSNPLKFCAPGFTC